MSEETPWAPPGLEAGSRLAGYLLEDEIGRGGMAVVYRAYDDRLERRVALKVLAPGLARDEAFRKRFIQESRAAAAVDHPHIVPVFDAGEAGGVLYLAMRYVPGGDVRLLLDRAAPLPVARACALVAQVAAALDAAHGHGLVHRDVKPSNMLLDLSAGPGRPDHVYLSDFGLAKPVAGTTGITMTGQFLGTVDYVAPEQIQGQPVDGRADQYSLACAAFEMLGGTPPFRREESMAVLSAKLSEPPPALAARRLELPAAVDVVMARALARDPAHRYRRCLDFAEALAAACGAGQEWAPQDWAARATEEGAAGGTTRGAAGETADGAAGVPPPRHPAAPAFPPQQPFRPQHAVPPQPAGPQSAGGPQSGGPQPGGPQSGGPQPGGPQPGGPQPGSTLLPPGRLSASARPPATVRQRRPLPQATSPLQLRHFGIDDEDGDWAAGSPSGQPGGAGTGRPVPGHPDRPPQRRAAIALAAAVAVVLLTAGAAFLASRQGGGTGTAGSSGPSAAASSPPVTPAAPLGPAATVKAYVAAINSHDYARAWALGGKNTGTTFPAFVNCFRGTGHDTVIILSVVGHTVLARLTAQQISGPDHIYQGTYRVTNGVITRFNVTRIS